MIIDYKTIIGGLYMDNNQKRALVKCIVSGIVISIVLVGIGFIIKSNSSYTFKDIIFLEGIALIGIAVLASIGGNPLGLSMQGLGSSGAQYAATANLEITKREKESTKDLVKNTLSIGLSTISLVLGGLICIVINFII